ncbi:MAG: cysteine--tRNA ligase [Gammaproteobacteria bacterium]|nr:cysteine--tRNA ligase [Gammaproteobacteria bacterium]
MLKIYNSLTKEKQTFEPIEPGKVRMYVCGMTVYDYCHVGHARVLVVFDVVYRYLQRLGYDVTYVRNITDIDDKIIRRAIENGEEYGALTERFIQAMHEDAKAIGVLQPDIEPRATDNISEILEMISALEQKSIAYGADNGDVYYSVKAFPEYGKLSHKKLEDLQAGSRVEVDEAKRDPLDFVLWKAAKPDEPSWDSPWGKGRPGWHIECSAMSTRFLGNHFDIHGGGLDLQFPHHENEIAQSEGCTGEHFVNYWMHNGFVRINEEKMSKSLGNFFTLREVLERYQGEEIRAFILSSHYRSPLNYSDEQLDNARQALTRLYTALRGLELEGVVPPADTDYEQRFMTAMNDDFNTAEALAAMFDLARDVNKARETNVEQATQLGVLLRQLGGILGLLQDAPESYLKGGDATSAGGFSDDEINSMIEARQQARAEKNWAESDRIRDQLQDAGIILEDGPQGTSWRRG